MYKITVNDKYHFETTWQDDEVIVNGQPQRVDIANVNSLFYNIIKDSVSNRVEVISFDRLAKSAEIKVNNNVRFVAGEDGTKLRK
jgi:hypothetical protein